MSGDPIGPHLDIFVKRPESRIGKLVDFQHRDFEQQEEEDGSPHASLHTGEEEQEEEEEEEEGAEPT